MVHGAEGDEIERWGEREYQLETDYLTSVIICNTCK